jgi:hypothetical protein
VLAIARGKIVVAREVLLGAHIDIIVLGGIKDCLYRRFLGDADGAWWKTVDIIGVPRRLNACVGEAQTSECKITDSKLNCWVGLQLDVLVQYIGEGKTVEIRLGGQKKSVVRTSEGVAKTLAHEDFHTEFFKEEYKKLVSAIKETYSPNGYATSQDCEKVKIEINSLVYKKQVVLDTDKGEANHSSERWKNWIQTNGEALP